jgi:hypothetical protein
MKYQTKYVDGVEYNLSPYSGRWHKIITKPDPGVKPTARERRRADNPYTMLLLQSAAAAAKAARSQKMFVWVWLQYEAWRTKSATVVITNDELGLYGINREAKRQALLDFETAGLITVKRKGLQAVAVTLLDPDYLHIRVRNS